MKKYLIPVLGFALFCGGCDEDSIKDTAKKVTNKTGRFVGENATSFFSGVGEGIDNVATDFDIRLSAPLKEAGAEITIARQDSVDGATVLSLYLISEDPISGVLRLKMFSAEDKEIGRSLADVELGVDDAQYIRFALDNEIPLKMVQYLEMDQR